MTKTLIVIAILASSVLVNGQTTAPKKYQAKAPKSQPFDNKAFEKSNKTIIRWTGNAGFLINARGTTLMVDPLLKDFDMPVMINYPIAPKDVPHLDAVLITYSDNDHFSIPTNNDLAPQTKAFHSTFYVDSLMKNLGWTIPVLHSYFRIGEP